MISPAPISPKREWAQLHVGPGPHAPEIVHARYVAHRFARHAHDECTIGLIEEGTQSFTCRGLRQITPAGRMFIVNPGEAHTGESASNEGYVYRTLHAPTSLLASVAEEIRGPKTGAFPEFFLSVLDDDELAGKLKRFHRAVARGNSALETETLMLIALSLLIQRHSGRPAFAAKDSLEPAPVRRARDYLDVAYAQNVSLTDLAAVSGLSAFHLGRTFTAAVGLPPHAYQESLRIRRARQLIAAGWRLAEVALEVGYPDQSHLTRRFKRFVGMPPGRYARDRRIAQDRAPRTS
jgi:AraC-like DNA-binding protein